MRVAIVFRGISYCENYTHWNGKNISVDFRDNFNNINYNLIEAFKTNNHVDVYCCTYNNKYIHILNYLYESINTKIIDPMKMSIKSNQYVLDMMLDSLNIIDTYYDLIIMTRFDVNFTKKINNLDYDINKINFLCEANGSMPNITLNDDTLILFGGKYLENLKKILIELIRENSPIGHHMIYDRFIDKNSLNFMVKNRKYEIVNERPFIFFNREINYHPNEFYLNNIKFVPMINYKFNKCSLCCLDPPSHFKILKPPKKDMAIRYSLISNTTCINISFIIHLDSNIDSDFTLSCEGQNRTIRIIHRKQMFISETFTICRKINQNIYFRFPYNECISLILKDFNVNSVEQPIKIHFLSFYTEGEPFDLCNNMSDVKEQYENAITPHVDSVKFYTPRELTMNPESSILVKPIESIPNPYNPGVHNIGFLKWKPYIILKHVENANPNDIVYYRDGNVRKYPSILNNLDETRGLLNLILQDTDIFVPIENYPELKMKKNVKREIFEELGKYEYDYLESFGFNSSIVVCRKTNLSLAILREWLEGCMKDYLINYNTYKQQHVDFRWNVQEQSILNVILKKYICNKLLPYKYPFYSLNYRNFTFKNLTRVPKIAVLIAGELRNFDNLHIIDNNHKNLFEKYNCDLFISTWNKKGYSFNHGHNDKSKQKLENVLMHDIIRSFKNIININIEDYDDWCNKLDNKSKIRMNKGFYNNHSNILCPNTIYPQLYKVWNANVMKVEYEHLKGFKYDIVIRFRSDMLLVDPIPEEYLMEFISLDGKPEGKVFR